MTTGAAPTSIKLNVFGRPDRLLELGATRSHQSPDLRPLVTTGQLGYAQRRGVPLSARKRRGACAKREFGELVRSKWGGLYQSHARCRVAAPLPEVLSLSPGWRPHP